METSLKENNGGIQNMIRNSLVSLSGGKNSQAEDLGKAIKIKEKFGYYNQKAYEQLSQCFEEKFKRFSDNFISFGKNQSVSVMEVKKIQIFIKLN